LAHHIWYSFWRYFVPASCPFRPDLLEYSKTIVFIGLMPSHEQGELR
jgi:hypothetical protein